MDRIAFSATTVISAFVSPVLHVIMPAGLGLWINDSVKDDSIRVYNVLRKGKSQWFGFLDDKLSPIMS